MRTTFVGSARHSPSQPLRLPDLFDKGGPRHNDLCPSPPPLLRAHARVSREGPSTNEGSTDPRHQESFDKGRLGKGPRETGAFGAEGRASNTVLIPVVEHTDRINTRQEKLETYASNQTFLRKSSDPSRKSLCKGHP